MASGEANHEENSRMTRRLVGAAFKEAMGVVIVAVTLFLSAGRLDWIMGWALVGLYALWVAATAVVLIPTNPALYLERAARRRGGKSWDVAILSGIGLATLIKQVVAGLDVRYDWTAPMPLALQIGAMVVAAGGYALTTWALAVNRFFSKVVRIQDDRQHRTVTQGPYRFVRHPGYVGTIIFDLATPIMLGSLWAMIPGVVSAALTLVRTALEDRALIEELDGYAEYADRVRSRLLPGIW